MVRGIQEIHSSQLSACDLGHAATTQGMIVVNVVATT